MLGPFGNALLVSLHHARNSRKRRTRFVCFKRSRQCECSGMPLSDLVNYLRSRRSLTVFIGYTFKDLGRPGLANQLLELVDISVRQPSSTHFTSDVFERTDLVRCSKRS